MPLSALVITADDLGIDSARDDGIFALDDRGMVSRASLLVNGASTPRAARIVGARGLATGLHLNLTEGIPCAPLHQVRTLLSCKGPYLRGKFGFREALAAGAIDPGELLLEVRAQLAAYRALRGAAPTHVDGHQHVHVIPRVASLIAPLLSASGVRTTRIPWQEHPGRGFHREVSDDAAAARPLYERAGIRSNRAFIGLDLMGWHASLQRVLRALRAVRGCADVEYMCHPGFAGHAGDAFNRSMAREHELGVLGAKGLRQHLRRAGFALESSAALAAGGVP